MKQLGTGQINRGSPEAGKNEEYFSSCSIFIRVGALGIQPGSMCAHTCVNIHANRHACKGSRRLADFDVFNCVAPGLLRVGGEDVLGCRKTHCGRKTEVWRVEKLCLFLVMNWSWHFWNASSQPPALSQT